MGKDTTEPQVVAVHDALGWWWKTYYWLAGRNVCYGLANRFRPAYDFGSIVFNVFNPHGTVCKITATWKGGSATEYILSLGKLHFYVGYKLRNAYLNSIDPLVVNPKPDTDPATDVGGVPELTAKWE